MGIVDQHTWALTCDDCGSTDAVMAVDKGRNSWRSPSDTRLFKVQVVSGPYGPEVVSATCKICGKAARVVGSD